MTTVGKILVVLHLVLSILFMAFAGAVFTAQKNWRTVATTNIGLLAKANTKLQDQQSEFKREQNQTAQKIAELSGDKTKLLGEKAALATQVASLSVETSNLTLLLDAMKDQANSNGVEAAERVLETKVRLVENTKSFESREELIKKLHDVEDKRFALEQQLQQMLERHERVLNDLRVFKTYNGSKGWPTDPKQMVAQTTPPPPVEGKIERHDKDKKNGTELVQITIGSDDGLSEGHVMTVYNSEKGYLAKIRLTYVGADKAVGVVFQKAKNMVVQVGDKVTTKI